MLMVLQIHSNPEILWQEHKAHDLLCRIFESHGFDVERGAFSLPTAFRATYGPAGARAVAINLELVLMAMSLSIKFTN